MTIHETPAELEAFADDALDAKLDAALIASTEAHLASCAECRAEVARFRDFSASLRNRLPNYPASDLLHARMQKLVTSSMKSTTSSSATVDVVAPNAARTEIRSPRNWKIFALAASAMLAVVTTHDFLSRSSGAFPTDAANGSFAQQMLVDAHIRSLMSDHLTDIPASDRHVVKPWFEGKVNFSPSVYDFADDGFPLAGGRLDYATGHAIAAIVFHSGQHAINLFVWPSDSGDAAIGSTSRDGYNLASWRRSHLQYTAVSTLNSGSLAHFAALYVARDSTTNAVQR